MSLFPKCQVSHLDLLTYTSTKRHRSHDTTLEWVMHIQKAPGSSPGLAKDGKTFSVDPAVKWVPAFTSLLGKDKGCEERNCRGWEYVHLQQSASAMLCVEYGPYLGLPIINKAVLQRRVSHSLAITWFPDDHKQVKISLFTQHWLNISQIVDPR